MDETRSPAVPASPTSADNIHARIDAWRDGAGAGMELHQFLGWSWKQYVGWVKSGSFPEQAVPAA